MHINKKLIEKNAISIYLSARATYTSNEATKLNLNATATKVGKKFTLTEDGGVKIGKDISAVAVSGSIYFFTGTNHADGKETIIYKNSTPISVGNTRLNYNYVRVSAPLNIIPVQEGDILYLYATNNTTSATVIESGIKNTFLTVVEI